MGKNTREPTGNSGFRGTLAPGGRVTRGGVALLFLLGLLCTLAGAVPLLLALPVLLNSEETLATVTAIEQLPDPGEYRAWVEFTTHAGQPIRVSSDFADRRRVRRLVPGQQVKLYYARTDPQRVELHTRQTFWVNGRLWLIPGIFMLWLSGQAWQSRKLPPNPPNKRRHKNS